MSNKSILFPHIGLAFNLRYIYKREDGTSWGVFDVCIEEAFHLFDETGNVGPLRGKAGDEWPMSDLA